MKTLLLVAGRSQRFWPLSEKPLWPFLGESLLTHQLKRLIEGGLTNITFVGGNHNLHSVQEAMPDVPVIEQEDLSLGMRGALLSALPKIGNEPVCIVSSNDVIEAEGYQALLKASQQSGVDGALLAQRVSRYFPGGYLVTEGDHVTGVMEKPGERNEPSDLVNIVAHVHNHPEKLLAALQNPSSGKDDEYEIALTALCKDQKYVAVPYEGKWNAVKYPWHVLDVTDRFLSEIPKQKIHKSASIHKTAAIEGPVIIEEGVRVLPHASIKGPCYIGKNSLIGDGALVRQSIIGEHCEIGFGSEVVRSNLHSHVRAHNTYLGDSVIGHNVAFGAGSVAANLRLDEGEITSVIKDDKINTQKTKLGVIVGDNVRTGIHTSFGPGVKIGSGSFVNSATYVSRDVAEGKYVHTKEGVLEERENRSEVPKAGQ
jgi:bifunctional UDP-N-acetylglucosamine pyrophosphorylase/glucosamine-1-phosphate N-acetyltransferase